VLAEDAFDGIIGQRYFLCDVPAQINTSLPAIIKVNKTALNVGATSDIQIFLLHAMRRDSLQRIVSEERADKINANLPIICQ
jgi:hypothetical protein